MSTNAKKNALVFDGTTGNVVQLDYKTAIERVKAVDINACNRLLKLHENVKFHNSALYEIAWSMKEINNNQDFLYYGYKSTADMMEAIYGYGKQSVSRMIAVSTYYTQEVDGKHVSFLYDYSTETDMPLSNLTELLEKAETMKYRVNELKELYTALFNNGTFNYSTKQKEMREIRKLVSNMISRSLPLNADNYYKLFNEKTTAQIAQNTPNAPNATNAPNAPNATNAPNAPNAPASKNELPPMDTLDEFKMHIFSIMDIMENEKDENKKAEMLNLMTDVYEKFKPTKKNK